MAPKVQTIAQAMKDLNPAFASTKKVINKQIANVPIKYDAQRAGLTAEKGQGFNAINNQATGRGASFSGIPVDEQATYLSTKYLPGMQQADFQQNDEQLTYNKELATLDKDLRTQALSTVNSQKSELTAWNKMLAEQRFQAAENAKNRAATAASNAANNPKLTPSAAAFGIISAGVAKGNLSVNQWNLARDSYTAAGGKAGQFASEFWKYVPDSAKNTGRWVDYYYSDPKNRR